MEMLQKLYNADFVVENCGFVAFASKYIL